MRYVMILAMVLGLAACNGSSNDAPAPVEQPETPTTPDTPTTPPTTEQPDDAAAQRVAEFAEYMIAGTDMDGLYNIGTFFVNEGTDPTKEWTLNYNIRRSIEQAPPEGMKNFVRNDAVYQYVDLSQLDDVITIDDTNTSDYPGLPQGTFGYKDFAKLNWTVSDGEQEYSVINARLMLDNLYRGAGQIARINFMFTMKDSEGKVSLLHMALDPLNPFKKAMVMPEKHDGPITESSGHFRCSLHIPFLGLSEEHHYESCEKINQMFAERVQFLEPSLGPCDFTGDADQIPLNYKSFDANSNIRNAWRYKTHKFEMIGEDGKPYTLTLNITETSFRYNDGGDSIYDVKVDGSFNDSRATGDHADANIGFDFYCNSATQRY